MRHVFVPLLVVALLAAAVPFALPAAMERAVEAALAERIGGDHRVTLAAAPVYRMLWGDFDRVRISATDLDAGPLRVARLSAELGRVRIDLPALLLEGALRVERSRRTRLRLEVLDQDLAAYLGTSPALSAVTLRIEAQRVRLEARLPEVGAGAHLVAAGRFVPAGDPPDSLLLDVEQVWVNGRPVPASFAERLLPLLETGGLTVELDLLAAPMRLLAVRAGEGRLIVDAETRRR